MKKPPLPTDPRHVAETYVNTPLSIFVTAGMVHLTLGIERPAAGSPPGPDARIEREVTVRLVLPTASAARIANAINTSLGVAAEASAQAVKN